MKKVTTVFISAAAACAMLLSGCTSTKTSEATKDQNEQQAAWESYEESESARDYRAEKVPDANAAEVYVITVYVPKEDGSGLEEKLDDVENKTGDAVFAKMKDNGAFSDEVALTGYSEKDGEATIQLSGADNLTDLQKQAISDTFAENFSLTKLTVTAGDVVIIEETYEETAAAGPGVQ